MMSVVSMTECRGRGRGRGRGEKDRSSGAQLSIVNELLILLVPVWLLKPLLYVLGDRL
jgi:hypothetical protein